MIPQTTERHRIPIHRAMEGYGAIVLSAILKPIIEHSSTQCMRWQMLLLVASIERAITLVLHDECWYILPAHRAVIAHMLKE